MDEFTFTLNSPITEEQWDAIADADFDHTNEIIFHTKHGKQVAFVKRMRGRWIEYPDVLKLAGALDDSYIGCSCCENVFNILDNDTERFNFCPNCGADMSGVRND